MFYITQNDPLHCIPVSTIVTSERRYLDDVFDFKFIENTLEKRHICRSTYVNIFIL